MPRNPASRQEDRRHKTRRRCANCDRLIYWDDSAVRISRCTGTTNPVGTLLGWICERCADGVTKAMRKAAS